MLAKRQKEVIDLVESYTTSQKIRRIWDEEKELWYFSVVDVIEILAQTDRPRKYWDDLKRKLKDEGGELSEKIGQLKMRASTENFI